MKVFGEITAEDIIALLDKSYSLIDVDYRSSFDDSLDAVAKAIRTQEWYPLDEEIEDWTMNAQWDSVAYLLDNQIKDAVMSEFELEDSDAEQLIENFRDEIVSAIYDRDDSDVIGDLIRNTTDPVMFYDTGVEIYSGCLSDKKERKEMLKDIKKALKIKLSETKWDDQIDMMIMQGDNGLLVIYFTADIKQMMNLSDKNIVTFSNPNVAIIDTVNGAGDNTQLMGHSFTIPFTLDNFFMDKEIKYSYTYEVCGMSSNWCDGTGIKFGKRKVRAKKVTKKSSIHNEMEYEERCNKTFKDGGCTPLDMDMRRHRDTYYLNEFPCGTHCPHCHTFWID